MQIKTIEQKIKAKMKEWLESISDEKLRKEVEENILVSGGSIASMLLREDVNDYDVYLKNIDVLKKLAEYYTKNVGVIEILDGRQKEKLIKDYEEGGGDINEANNYQAIAIRTLKEDQIKLFFTDKNGGHRIEKEDGKDFEAYEPKYFSPNAISLSNDVQIVLRFWGDNKKIHETFDFVHATNYFTFSEGLVRNLNAVESILTKQLKYQGSFYPLTSIIRMKKFLKRGFNINAGEILKIMFQISELDLTNPDVLEEQLIGVDVAYFETLISALRSKLASDRDFRLSNSYLFALIDKIFNENDHDE